jgi:hypothetical protein
MVETTTLSKKIALIIKYQGYKVGVTSKVRKSYMLNILMEYTILAKLVID